MATIRKRTLDSGKTVWQCDYRVQLGKRRARQFTKKRDPESHLAEAVRTIEQGSFVHAARGMTLETSIEDWLRHCEKRVGIGGEDNLERATFEDYRGKARNHLLNPDHGIGNLNLNRLTIGAVDDFRIRMVEYGTRGRTPANASKTVTVLSANLDWAQDHGIIAINPLLGRKRRSGGRDDRRVTPPSHDIIQRLIDACPTDKQLYVRFAALTGLRASEQRALRWLYTDLEKGSIEVTERVDKYQNVSQPKSTAGYRTVPMGSGLIRDLAHYKAEMEASDDDLVFANLDGSHLRHDVEMKYWFNPLRQRIDAPHLRWHDLRHYAISCWIEAGLNPKVIQTRAGHASIQTTYERYGHLLDKGAGGAEMAGIEHRLYGNGR